MTKHAKFFALVGLASLTATLACKPKMASNQDMLNEYGGEKYQDDMVATEHESHEHQGDSIDPRTQAAIQDTIATVYVSDFEKCLEKEMSRLENRWVAGPFSVELTIEPSGMVTEVKMLSVDVIERRTLNAKGEYVSEGGAAPRTAEKFADCVTEHVFKWEFDPPPEVTYSHTYNGTVGEAW